MKAIDDVKHADKKKKYLRERSVDKPNKWSDIHIRFVDR